MLSLVDKNPMMENEPQKLINNNSQEAVELLGLSSSDSLESPLFSQFQAPKKRKVRFKKPFRSNSRSKVSRNSSSKPFKCEIVETIKIFSYFALLAIVGALLWYVMTLSTRIQELQVKFSDKIVAETEKVLSYADEDDSWNHNQTFRKASKPLKQ